MEIRNIEDRIYVTYSPEETEDLGEKLGATLAGDETVALFGGMGMGKTAFVRGLARGLRLPGGEVSSPTFAIVHEHGCPGGGPRLYHFDMYRVETIDDLYSTGFFDYAGTGVIAAEWCENIRSALPEKRIEVRIGPGDAENERRVEIIHNS